jgi:hypothetical protein
LVYLVELTCSIIVDRQLEMLVVAFVAIMASVPWLTDFAGVWLAGSAGLTWPRHSGNRPRAGCTPSIPSV